VNVENSPYGVVVNSMGTKVYVESNDVATGNGTVSIIDTATKKVTATVNLESYLYGVAVTPDGTKVYVSNEYMSNDGNNTVSVIDTATNTVTATVIVGSYPYGVAVNPAGTKVYVANFASNTISVIDSATDTVTATVPVGGSPCALGQFIGGQVVLPVANFSTNVTSGYTPLSIQFTDLSQNITSSSWDFGDGANSIEQNPTHTYPSAGTYIVNLTAKNGDRTSLKSATITVLQVTGSSSESSGNNSSISSGGSSYSSGSSHRSGSRLRVVNNGENNNALSNSTGKMNTTGTAIQPQIENNTKGLEQNNDNIVAAVGQTPDKKNDTNTSGKGNKSTPGFEIVYCIACLLGVFLYKRK
jgi:YVTN family beta-propeller protein